MDANYELDSELMNHLEDKLNELSENAETKFNKVIGVELAVTCASMSAQLVMDGGSNEAAFVHFMTEIWRAMFEVEQEANALSKINVSKRDLNLN